MAVTSMKKDMILLLLTLLLITTHRVLSDGTTTLPTSPTSTSPRTSPTVTRPPGTTALPTSPTSTSPRTSPPVTRPPGSVINAAALANGATCTASSELDRRFLCKYAIDGNSAPGFYSEWSGNKEKVGLWLNVTFSKPYLVFGIMYLWRCWRADQTKEIRFTLNNNHRLTETIRYHPGGGSWSCTGTEWQYYSVRPFLASSLTYEVLGVYPGETNVSGIRELQVLAIALCSSNPCKDNEICSLLPQSMTCTHEACQEKYPSYTCQVPPIAIRSTSIYQHTFAAATRLSGLAVNVASLANGATCTASSQLDQRFLCKYAIDDNPEPGFYSEWAGNQENIGLWLEVTFSKPYRVHTIRYLQRCGAADQTKDVKFTFDYYYSLQKTMQRTIPYHSGDGVSDCARTEWQTFPVGSVTASSLRYEVLSVYPGTTDAPGIRELQVLARVTCFTSPRQTTTPWPWSPGTTSPRLTTTVWPLSPGTTSPRLTTTVWPWSPGFAENVASLASGATCTASSEIGPQFLCKFAIDDNPATVFYSEWAGNQALVGLWLWVIFSETYLVHNIRYLQTCWAADQTKDVRFTFDNDCSFQETIPYHRGAERSSCAGTEWQTYGVGPFLASSLKYEVLSVYPSTTNARGIRELQVLAYSKSIMKDMDIPLVPPYCRRSRASMFNVHPTSEFEPSNFRGTLLAGPIAGVLVVIIIVAVAVAVACRVKKHYRFQSRSTGTSAQPAVPTVSAQTDMSNATHMPCHSSATHMPCHSSATHMHFDSHREAKDLFAAPPSYDEVMQAEARLPALPAQDQGSAPPAYSTVSGEQWVVLQIL